MENVWKLSADTPPPAPDRHAATIPPSHHEWAILRKWPVNGLVVGPLPLTLAAVAAIDNTLQQPVVWWTPDEVRDVPEFTSGTLIVRDVSRLDSLQQERLACWIGAHSPQLQVLALSRAPLFDDVANGRFSAALYYRINTVVVEVRQPADLP